MGQKTHLSKHYREETASRSLGKSKCRSYRKSSISSESHRLRRKKRWSIEKKKYNTSLAEGSSRNHGNGKGHRLSRSRSFTSSGLESVESRRQKGFRGVKALSRISPRYGRYTRPRHRSLTRSKSPSVNYKSSRKGNVHESMKNDDTRENEVARQCNRKQRVSPGRNIANPWRDSSKERWYHVRRHSRPYPNSSTQPLSSAAILASRNKTLRSFRRVEPRTIMSNARCNLQFGMMRHRHPVRVSAAARSPLPVPHSNDPIPVTTRVPPSRPQGQHYHNSRRQGLDGANALNRGGRRRAPSPATWNHDQFFALDSAEPSKKRSVINLYAESFDQLVVQPEWTS